MVFNGIDGILGTGGRKAAYRGKQRRDQELIGPDQKKQYIRAPFLQKILHQSLFSCIRLPVKIFFWVAGRSGKSVFLLKGQVSACEHLTYGNLNVHWCIQTKTFPYRYNYIHIGQLTTSGTFFLQKTFV